MRGISAEGFAESVERLEVVAADGDAAQLGTELFAVAACWPSRRCDAL